MKIYRKSVSEETSDVRWVTINIAKNLLPPLFFSIIEQVDSIIRGNIKFISLQEVIDKYEQQEAIKELLM